MYSLRHSGTLALTAIAVALFALVAAHPGSAGAASFCVHHAGDVCGAGQVDAGADLQGALDDALQTNGPDEVLVGAGEYSGPFHYDGLQAVDIRGVGDATVLRTANGNGAVVLALLSTTSSVNDLRIDVPVGNSSQLNFGLQSRGAASGVNVVVPANPTWLTTGVVMYRGSFKDGSVTAPTQEFAGYDVTALATGSEAPVLIEDTALQAYQALSVAGAGTIRRVSALSRTGFQFQSEKPAGGEFLIEDSLWRTPPGATEGVGLQAGCGSNVDLHLTARNLTLVSGATGPNFNYGVAAVCNLPGLSASIDLSSSIVMGSAQSLNAWANEGPATIDVSYTDYDPAKTSLIGADAAITSGPGNLNVDPALGSDFRPLRESPLVDAGDPAGLAAGESLTDLAGLPRIAVGRDLARRDIGAYELQPPPPVPPLMSLSSEPPADAGGAAGDKQEPTLARLRLEPRSFRVSQPARGAAAAVVGTKIRFSLSEPAAVRLQIQRVLRGRLVDGRCRKPAPRLHGARACMRYRTVGTLTRPYLQQGDNTVAFSGRLGRRALEPGRFRVLADATDPSDNRSRPYSAGFRVLEPVP